MEAAFREVSTIASKKEYTEQIMALLPQHWRTNFTGHQPRLRTSKRDGSRFILTLEVGTLARKIALPAFSAGSVLPSPTEVQNAQTALLELAARLETDLVIGSCTLTELMISLLKPSRGPHRVLLQLLVIKAPLH